MNKKSLAVVMSAVTVIGSAAPVFAAAEDTFPEGKSTVSSSKYSDIERILKNYVKAGKTVNVNFYDKKGVSKGVSISGLEENQISYVKDEVKDLKSGESAKIVVVGDKGEPAKYTDAELKELDGDAVVEQVKKATAVKFVDQDGNTLDPTKPEDKVKLQKYDTAAQPSAGFVDATPEDYLQIIKDSVTKSKYTNKAGNAATGTVAITAALPAASNDGELQITVGTNSPAKTTLDTAVTTALDGTVVKFDFTKPIITLDTTTGASKVSFEKTDEIVGATGSEVTVIAASDETVTISGDAKEKAQTLAKKYVFKDSELENAYKTVTASDFEKTDNDYYEVVLYPTGKRLNTASTYASSNYKPELPTSDRVDTPAIITLRSTNKNNLKSALDELRTYNNSYSNNSVLAGDDRIETAIEISKDSYNADKGVEGNYVEANEVVLVGSQSIVDGLVASPLAAVKNAPLLLTSKDKLDSSVKSEIKRVMGLDDKTGITSKKTVYIAGGENSVSKEVANELKDMGLKVERLSGDDRYATSLEIADEIGLNHNKVFVVGGTGLADAMSIASVASNKEMPIVVVDGKGKDLSADAKDFIGSAYVDIIGGKSSVSEDMEDAIDDATGKSPERVSGDDRQDTNAEVIKTYFEKDNDDSVVKNGVKNFYVAKDGSTKEDQLVDALAIAAVAGKYEAPIVLATDSLSSDQSVAISKVTNSDDSKKLTQVGKGIADSVIKRIKDLLEL
ncbi:TPA: S-layer protein SlpA [Clostridioides difficile]|nr:S-layer protein SlpA [Clostridioides difficile]